MCLLTKPSLWTTGFMNAIWKKGSLYLHQPLVSTGFLLHCLLVPLHLRTPKGHTTLQTYSPNLVNLSLMNMSGASRTISVSTVETSNTRLSSVLSRNLDLLSLQRLPPLLSNKMRSPPSREMPRLSVLLQRPGTEEPECQAHLLGSYHYYKLVFATTSPSGNHFTPLLWLGSLCLCSC